ncbi:ABC transporter substrate-binding protein [Acidiphilium sp. AL]|uniref:ABC transporter substrate-binding protein n=1 Tax=Acidiphilium iwatense TaxID=768198 RepID=A0ABS9DUI0_9PROT|nr:MULTISPECIES: ABC transporter substrate-binding protein [Acidiphilium]MCF3946388.1 ABC transporter substrate-binding protein [Acidiphilium iwatense]MCU4159829.1 ABC transporter substrate-binding protein [Acidiphilium sp. AL]
MSKTKTLLASTAFGALALLGVATAQAAPDHAAQMIRSTSKAVCVNPHPDHAKLSALVVGFSQSQGNENPFRAEETKSLKDAAASFHARRYIYTNAHSNEAKQVADVESMINQGAQALVIAPLNATGLQPAFAQAAAKHIPIITIDRHTAGTNCTDYLSFMGSNFYKQGEISGEQLARATHGHAVIAEIQGAYGNSVETARTNGFAAVIKKHPGMKIVAAQTGNWSTTDAQKVMSEILLAHPNVNAVYTQSDTMAYGAITALRDAGKKPRQVKIVTIDGTKQGVQDIADGWIYADDETNPRFGPIALHEIQNWLDGKPVPQHIVIKDHLYTKANAKAALNSGVPY